jgi:protein-export membrane protein SecD
MSNLRWKWSLLVVLLVIFGWYLVPTVRYYAMPASERSSDSPSVANIRSGAMKLGLDLQGGSYLVYEVDLAAIPQDQRRGDEVDRAMQIIRNRVDQFGVTEPIIQRQGENRIVVQLPGMSDPERAKELVGKTARLEFRLVKTRQEFFQALSAVDQVVARRQRGLSAAADSAAADSLLANENPFSGLLQQANPDAGYAYCPAENLDRAMEIWSSVAWDSSASAPRVLAGNTVLLWGNKEFGAGSGNPGRFLYALTSRPELTGDHVADARVAFGLEPTRPNAPGISLTLDKRGGGIFTRLTGANVGRQLAIILDNRVQSAPVIRDKIRGGRASITGLEGDEEARDLGIVLRAGALPTDLVLQEERTVGPTLGRDSIEQGVRAAVLGFVLVVLLMLVYYQLSGALAVLALVLNIFFMIATLGMLRGTLTLPGIAGIVLTIGIAVDANILILERIREELRGGKTVRGAIEAGYGRALVTIIDSNLTTLISAIVLFQFGTGPIKGFATTLMIGIIANVFTAVFVTRLVYDSIMAKRPIQKLSI